MHIYRAIGAAFMLLASTSIHAQETESDVYNYGPVQPSEYRYPSGPTVDQGEDAADLPMKAIRGPGYAQSAPSRFENDGGQTSVNVGAGGVTTITVQNGAAPSWGMVAGRNPSAYIPLPPQPNFKGYANTPRLEAPDIDIAGVAQAVRVPRDSATGHFVATVHMNGVKTRVIIDTGATGTILSPKAAHDTGADRDITHAQYAAGIGGVTTLNATRVRSFVIGGREIGGFDALIGREGIPYTLLGQTELRRLGRIVIEDDVLTIMPSDPRVASR